VGDVVHQGVHGPLERAADELIFGSLKGVTSQAEKSDILTPWKEQDRRNREVLSTTGSVDPAIRRGMYHRVYNRSQAHLNSRDGETLPTRIVKIDSDWVITSTSYKDGY
jgi:hypothetical protein